MSPGPGSRFTESREPWLGARSCAAKGCSKHVSFASPLAKNKHDHPFGRGQRRRDHPISETPKPSPARRGPARGPRRRRRTPSSSSSKGGNRLRRRRSGGRLLRRTSRHHLRTIGPGDESEQSDARCELYSRGEVRTREKCSIVVVEPGSVKGTYSRRRRTVVIAADRCSRRSANGSSAGKLQRPRGPSSRRARVRAQRRGERARRTRTRAARPERRARGGGARGGAGERPERARRRARRRADKGARKAGARRRGSRDVASPRAHRQAPHRAQRRAPPRNRGAQGGPRGRHGGRGRVPGVRARSARTPETSARRARR